VQGRPNRRGGLDTFHKGYRLTDPNHHGESFHFRVKESFETFGSKLKRKNERGGRRHRGWTGRGKNPETPVVSGGKEKKNIKSTPKKKNDRGKRGPFRKGWRWVLNRPKTQVCHQKKKQKKKRV